MELHAPSPPGGDSHVHPWPPHQAGSTGEEVGAEVQQMGYHMTEAEFTEVM